MTPAGDVLLSLYRRGAKLWLENGQLRYRAPRGALLEDDVNKLRELKPQIIEFLQRAAASIDAPFQPRPPGCSVPLTALQRRWVKILKDGRLSKRWLTVGVRVTGPLDPALLRASIEAVVARHESLRTRFVSEMGTLLHRIDPPGAWHLEVLDLTGLPAEEADRQARQLARDLVNERIDITEGPLFGSRLLKLSDGEHILILAFDHLISDGVSKEIVNREIWTLYDQGRRGLPFSLPRLPLQFADYAVWQDRTHAAWLEEHAEYWITRFAGAPRLRLPSDESPTTDAEPIGAAVHVSFGTGLSARLDDLARKERTLRSLTVFCVFAIAISRWCHERDLVLAFVSNGRHRPELEHVTGFVAGALFLRIQIAEEDGFLDLLRRVTLEYWTAHEHLDFDRVPDIVPECASDLYTSGVYFNWVPASGEFPWQSTAEVRLERFDPNVIPPSRFLPLFRDTPSGIELTVLHRPDVFAPGTMERFGHDVVSIAEHFTRYPNDRVLERRRDHDFRRAPQAGVRPRE